MEWHNEWGGDRFNLAEKDLTISFQRLQFRIIMILTIL